MKQKTVYFTDDLLNRIGEHQNFSARVNELIEKGLSFEQSGNKITFERALGYFNAQYRKTHPDKPLP